LISKVSRFHQSSFMKTEPLYPLLFEPVYKDYLWGGNRISQSYGRTGTPEICAESWEISAHPDGMSVVSNGSLAGKTLADLVSHYGAALQGTRAGTGPFPLLLKIIDAAQVLSVQVHPDNPGAAKYGGEPKTEMWYVLDAVSDAALIMGLQPGTDPARCRQAIDAGELETLLTWVAAKPSDAFFIPGGRVHGLGIGCLILEVQQNSNTTYRLYDWDRVDADGLPRQLHIEKAFEVIRWQDDGNARVPRQPLLETNQVQKILVCGFSYFRVEKWTVRGALETDGTPETFQAFFCAQGEVILGAGEHTVTLKAGDSCLVPAGIERFTLRPEESCELLQVTVP
jgi:mannose-6-phosphate isomerase